MSYEELFDKRFQLLSEEAETSRERYNKQLQKEEEIDAEVITLFQGVAEIGRFAIEKYKEAGIQPITYREFVTESIQKRLLSKKVKVKGYSVEKDFYTILELRNRSGRFDDEFGFWENRTESGLLLDEAGETLTSFIKYFSYTPSTDWNPEGSGKEVFAVNFEKSLLSSLGEEYSEDKQRSIRRYVAYSLLSSFFPDEFNVEGDAWRSSQKLLTHDHELPLPELSQRLNECILDTVARFVSDPIHNYPPQDPHTNYDEDYVFPRITWTGHYATKYREKLKLDNET